MFLPIGLQYGGTAGSILNQSRATNSSGQRVGLQVQAGRTLALVGGDVRLDGGRLDALGGRVEVGGVAGTGTVGLSVNDNNLGLSFGNGVARADVSLTNSSRVNVRSGGGGSIAINARNIEVLGKSRVFSEIGPDLGSVGAQAGDITLNATQSTIIEQSIIQNDVNRGAIGSAGNINITALSLSLRDQSLVSTSTAGQGDAGNLSLQVDGSVSKAGGSAIVSGVFLLSRGNGGNIDIQARSLSLTDGSEVLAWTFGAGNTGNIQVKASEFINLSGVSPTRIDPAPDVGVTSGFSSGLFTSTEQGASGEGGNIQVTTNALGLSDGAVLSARTVNAFRGGDIFVDANTLNLTGGGQILTTAYSSGRAGNITVNAADSITLAGSDPTYSERLEQFGRLVVDNDGPASAMSARSEGALAAGSLSVTTGQLRVQDGALVTVSGEELANAGNLQVAARNLRLDNFAALTAESVSGSGGNIALFVGDLLLLRRNSRISNTAGNAQIGGNGGNLSINTKAIAAVPSENSDISTNAFTGTGGNIQIKAEAGIFGTEFRYQLTPLSDIVASGTIELNTLTVDPSFTLTDLPTGAR